MPRAEGVKASPSALGSAVISAGPEIGSNESLFPSLGLSSICAASRGDTALEDSRPYNLENYHGWRDS